MKDHTPAALLQLYYERSKKDGQKPKRIYALVSLGPPGEHEKGYMIAWGVNRGYVETRQDRRGDAAHLEIQELEAP